MKHSQTLESGETITVTTEVEGIRILLTKGESPRPAVNVMGVTLNKTEMRRLITALDWAMGELGVDGR